MKKTLLIVSGIAVLGVFAACEATEEITDAIVTDQPAVCQVVPATDLKAACIQYRMELCDRHVVCGTYDSMTTCEAWFNTNYGACEEAPTDALDAVKQANLKTCLCELPDAVCTSLVTAGAEATIPECGQF